MESKLVFIFYRIAIFFFLIIIGVGLGRDFNDQNLGDIQTKIVNKWKPHLNRNTESDWYLYTSGQNYGNPWEKTAHLLKQQNVYFPLVDLNEFWYVDSMPWVE